MLRNLQLHLFLRFQLGLSDVGDLLLCVFGIRWKNLWKLCVSSLSCHRCHAISKNGWWLARWLSLYRANLCLNLNYRGYNSIYNWWLGPPCMYVLCRTYFPKEFSMRRVGRWSTLEVIFGVRKNSHVEVWVWSHILYPCVLWQELAGEWKSCNSCLTFPCKTFTQRHEQKHFKLDRFVKQQANKSNKQKRWRGPSWSYTWFQLCQSSRILLICFNHLLPWWTFMTWLTKLSSDCVIKVCKRWLQQSNSDDASVSAETAPENGW